MQIRIAVASSLLALVPLISACRDESRELTENVEESARVYDETYDDARSEGENAIEAGGDAYNAVLEIPEEKEEREEKAR